MQLLQFCNNRKKQHIDTEQQRKGIRMSDDTQVQNIPEVPEVQTVTTSTPNHVIITLLEDKRAKWYVVHTYSGHENKVAETLKQRTLNMGLEKFILEMLIPTRKRFRLSAVKADRQGKDFPRLHAIKLILPTSHGLLCAPHKV